MDKTDNDAKATDSGKKTISNWVDYFEMEPRLKNDGDVLISDHDRFHKLFSMREFKSYTSECTMRSAKEEIPDPVKRQLFLKC